MMGDLGPICDEFYSRLWFPLSQQSSHRAEFWTELFGRYAKHITQGQRFRISGLTDAELINGTFGLHEWITSGGYVDASTQDEVAEDILGKVQASHFDSEANIVLFLEDAYQMCLELEGDELASVDFNLTEALLDRFNCRYELRTPYRLCPCMRGLVAGLLAETNEVVKQSPNLTKLKRELDESFRDLRMGCDEGRIKTCLSRQYMFIEALADYSSSKNGRTLGEALKTCDWPHTVMRSLGGNLYGLRSDYPGLGHGSNSSGVLRDIDTRDLLGVSLMLSGLIPYVSTHVAIESVVFQDGTVPIQRGTQGSDDRKRVAAKTPWYRRRFKMFAKND